MLIDEYLRTRIEGVKAQLEREGYQPETEEIKPVGDDVPVDFREPRPVIIPVMASQLEALCDVAKTARHSFETARPWGHFVNGDHRWEQIAMLEQRDALAKLDDPNLPEPVPQRVVFSKLRSETDVKVTVSETEEDGKIRVQVDTRDAGLQAIMEREGWTREEVPDDGASARTEIRRLCREHALISERVDPGGRVLVFPGGEVRLYEMPGSDDEDLAAVRKFLGRAAADA